MTDKELANIVLEYIKTIYAGEVKVDVVDILKDVVVNLYIPETETCILCNSCFDHRTVYKKDGTSFKMAGGKNNTYHFKVSKQLREMGKRPIQIWEDQWLDARLQPTIKAILKAALNVNDTTKIYARNCEIKEVPADEYKKFCNANHTQLSRAASVRLGLYHNGELVQIASFNKYHALNKAKAKDPSKAKSASYDWDFVRGCFPGNYEVMTDKGFIRLDAMPKYKDTVKVCAWDKDTQKLFFEENWQPVKEFHKTLVTCKFASSVEIQANPEHILPIKNHKKIKDYTVSELVKKGNDKVLCVSEIGVDREYNPDNFKTEILNIITQADGHLSGNRIYFRFEKDRKIERLESFLKQWNIEYKKSFTESDGAINISIQNMFTFDPKTLHIDYTKLSKQEAYGLFSEMCNWDGYVCDRYIQYFSSIKENADIAQILVHLAGKNESLFKHKTCWTVSVSLTKKPGNYSLGNLEKTEQPLNDYLYCLQVPSKYFVVRANNKIFITHNCEAFNHSRVVGGVSKLFKYFVKTYNPKNVLCYSDFNFFNGIGYANAGFKLIGYTGSDKFYINPANMTRINRSASHYRQYMEKVIVDEWYCCYGAGSLIFFWENPAMVTIQPIEDTDESK